MKAAERVSCVEEVDDLLAQICRGLWTRPRLKCGYKFSKKKRHKKKKKNDSNKKYIKNR